jgi:hypothetical protein
VTATKIKPASRRAENRLKVMSHPLRRAILRFMIEWGKPVSPVEIGRGLDVDLKLVSYHCRELVKFDCIEKVGVEQVRGALKSFYVPTDRHLIDDDEWADLDPSLREGALIDFMEPMVRDFTDAVKDGILGEDALWHITRTPVHAIDQQGLEELLAAHRELYERVAVLQAESLERMGESGEEPVMVSTSQACFKVRTF